jgi:hypothetical protein
MSTARHRWVGARCPECKKYRALRADRNLCSTCIQSIDVARAAIEGVVVGVTTPVCPKCKRLFHLGECVSSGPFGCPKCRPSWDVCRYCSKPWAEVKAAHDAHEAAPSADPVDKKVLEKALLVVLDEAKATDTLAEEAEKLAAVAIAHCEQRESEQRQRAEKAEADSLERQDCAARELARVKAHVSDQADEIARLKEGLAEWKETAANLAKPIVAEMKAAQEAGQPAPEADLDCPENDPIMDSPAPEGLPEVGVCSFCHGGSKGKVFVLATTRAAVCNECLGELLLAASRAMFPKESQADGTQPQAQEGKKE